jgi:hypothetical protein
LVRGLYFYPPPAPSPAVFPNLSGPELIKGCVLAIVRVEAASSRSEFKPQRVGEERAAEFARPINQAMRERFTKKYGTSVGMESIPFWGPGSRWYQDAARWVPNAEIVSGYDVKGGHMPDEDALVFPPFVFVRGRMPLVQEWQVNIIGRSHRDPAKEAALFRQAVAAAGVCAAISQRMEKLYEVDTALADRLEKQVEEMCKSRCLPKELPRPKKDDWGEPIVPLLQDWFRALQTADPAHRAAGLLVADRVLIAFGSVRPWDRFGDVQSSTPEQSKRRSDLQNLGATFEPAYGDASYHYVGNWLDQAKDLDRDSEGGTLALLTWMSSSNTCGVAAGSEAFRVEISEGETLLTKKIDAPTAAQIHFMVGDAYSDIVRSRRENLAATVNMIPLSTKPRPRLTAPRRCNTTAPAWPSTIHPIAPKTPGGRHGILPPVFCPMSATCASGTNERPEITPRRSNLPRSALAARSNPPAAMSPPADGSATG